MMQAARRIFGPAPPELEVAIHQFNAGDYYACHETLEELWLAERSDLRHLYQGILQVGVGLYHLRRANAAGALSLLERGPRLLLPFAPATFGIDVAALLNAAAGLRSCLQSAGLAAARSLLEHDPPCIRRTRTSIPD